ncbi:MAG TPA: hypothetical protein VF731_13890 [Solirubrobacterales bacterium]
MAVDWLTGGDREGLPIVAPGTRTVVGWLDHRDVLRAYAGAAAPPPRPPAAPVAGEAPALP